MPAPASAVVEPAAPPEANAPAAAAAREDGARESKTGHRHHRSPPGRVQADRVARGLSIDPFAEAARGGKP
jgi:hypothetical protein